jgi:hypothetical protein
MKPSFFVEPLIVSLPHDFERFALPFLPQRLHEYSEWLAINAAMPTVQRAGSGATETGIATLLSGDNQDGCQRQSGWMTPGSAAGWA